MITGVEHVQLAMPRGGEEVAAGFYEGILGIPRVPKPPHLAARGGCWFESDAVKIHLGVEDDFRPARKAHPALLVDDLPRLIDDLTAAGHDVRGEVDQFYVDDPFGNRIELLPSLG